MNKIFYFLRIKQNHLELGKSNQTEYSLDSLGELCKKTGAF